MTRADQGDRYKMLCLAIRALARRGVPLVIASREGGFDFEMDGKPVGEHDVLMRASMLDLTLFALLHGESIAKVRLAA